ncbi:centrosomal protein of 295 kDa isoform X2 [Antechinus flavipes]|uniref:centrosomal protein of 295 kDa isoform X2 n=1 Tax=Antechinus flavipes TaxID=38775 RepID=UPI0022357CEC|nr:centrosomal protein of 295 kDa isoform X2 [Antechinus flavipes]
MKRKVTKVGNFRFSPNEEALLLKEEYERRRKQRLLQVREQERCIASQLRQEVKQRRDQYLHHLAEELRVEWEKTQKQKIKELENLYIASLRCVGEGHRSAKENDPRIHEIIKQREERQQRAEERGQEALKKMKKEKEKLLKKKSWYVETRKKVLLEEKERAAKIASLPPPPPDPFEAVLTLKTYSLPGKGTNVQVKGISTLKSNTASNPPTYHHLGPSVINEEKDVEQNLQLKQISKITSTTTCTSTITTCSTYNFEPTVEREMEVQQPDPHLAAEEETKRLEKLQKEAIQEKREQLEKAHIRGIHAMRKVHLAKNREKIMKELEQLQQVDLARRRQNVAQMPPQVVELPYKRMEIKEDWQRELEFAFEDMYNADRKVKGDLILKLEPEPLPVVTELMQDEELDLSMEQDCTSEIQNQERMEEETPFLTETKSPLAQETHHAPSKTVLKKLLDRIQSQRSQWANKYTSEDENEMPKNFVDGESETIETGTLVSEEKPLDKSEHTTEQGETKQLSGLGGETFKTELETDLRKEQPCKNLTESGNNKGLESSESEISQVDEKSVLLDPHEEATDRQKQMMKLEQQKQKQLALIRQIEQQRIRLESECLKARKTQLELERKKIKERIQQFYLRYMKSYPFVDQWKKEASVVPQHLMNDAPTIDLEISREDCSREMIHNYQQHLLQQNRFHKQSIDAARKRLHEYQNMLKQRYPSQSTKNISSDFVKPKHESLDRKTLTFQARSCLPGVSQLPTLYSLPSYPIITGNTHLLSLENNERISSGQTAFSYSGSLIQPSVPSAEPESKLGRIQDLFSTESQISPQFLSHFISSEARPFLSSDHILSQKDSLKTVQEPLEVQKETFHFTEKTPEELIVHRQTELEERMLSNQTGFSPSIPSFPQHSLSLSASAVPESERIQEPFSIKNDNIVPSSYSLKQIIPDRLLSSEDTLYQQCNLNAVRKQLNIQREALHSCLKAQAKLVSHKSALVEGKVPSSQTVPLVPQRFLGSSLSAKSDCGGVQKHFLTKSESTIASSPPLKQVFQDRPLISEDSLHQVDSMDILKAMQQQWALQKEAFNFGQKTQELNLVNRPIAVQEKKSSSQTESPLLPLSPQLALGSSPSDESESVGIQEFHLTKRDTTYPLDYSTTQDQCLTSSEPIIAQQDKQEQLDLQKDLFLCSEKAHPAVAEEGILSSHTRPSLVPLIPQHSYNSLHSAKSESGGIRFPLPRKCEPEICPSSVSSIQIFEDKVLAPSQHILPQQRNQMAIQEPRNVQTEAFCISEKIQEELLVQSKMALEERLSSNQADFSFLPLISQHSFTSLPSTESGSIQITSSHPATPNMQIFQKNLLASSEHILPQQDDLNLQQEQLDLERKAFHFDERAQYQTLVNERFSAQADSFVPSLAVHAGSPPSNSEEIQNPLIGKSESTNPTRYSTDLVFQDRVSTSDDSQYQQDNFKAIQEQLNIHREVLSFGERSQLQYHDYKLAAMEERTSNQADSSPFLPQLPLHSVSSLPSAEAESLPDSEEYQESFLTSQENTFPSSQSSTQMFQDKLLASSKHFSSAQDNLEVLQKQLNIQKEYFEGRQKAQEEWLLQRRQTGLEEELQKHEEALKDSLYENQANKSVPQNVKEIKPVQFTQLFLSQEVERNHQEGLNHTEKSKCDDRELLLENINADEHIGQPQNRDLRQRLSKPPVAKIRAGLDLNQHELSVIQEVESPKSGRASTKDKRECYKQISSKLLSNDLDSNNHEETIVQYRDPVRISVSQYLSLGDGSQESNQAASLQTAKPIHRSSDDGMYHSGQTENVIMENHELLSYAADLEQKVLIYPGSTFKPKKILPSIPWSSNDFGSQSHVQELQDDQSSSLTVSSGSFLSNEKSHLNLENSELEQTFPHLYHQLFHALEPRPDLDFSSSVSQSGLSQDLSKTTYPSTPASHDTVGSHESTNSTTAMRATSFHSSLGIDLHSAMNRMNVSLDSSQTENLPKEKTILALSEELFQPLQPESVLSDSSYCTEGPSQNFKKEKFSLGKQYEELPIQKRNADVCPRRAVLQSPTFTSSDDPHLFDRMRVPHSTPYDSSSSKSSTKDQIESRKEDLGFDEMKGSQTDVITGAPSETDSRCVVRDPETCLERSSGSITSEESVEIFRNTPQQLPSSFLISLRSCSIQSSVPVWETISGHGIMEEAELTLISSTDNSDTNSDVENLIEEQNKGSELKSCFQVKQDSELKEDYSVWKPDLTVTELPEERPSSSFQHPDTFQECSSAPGSLQEAFVKEKISLVQQSSQRQKEINNETQTSGKSQPKSTLQIERKKYLVERKSSESSVSHLKKVNEVKVCFPEARKTAQSLRHHQALRLFNQLAEVRQQKEEKSRQDASARNRERAREFHRMREVFCLECNNYCSVWRMPELAVAESTSFHLTEPAVSELKTVNEVKVCVSEDTKIEQSFMKGLALRLYNQLTEVTKQQKEKQARQED